MTGDGLDAFNMTLSYLLHEAVGGCKRRIAKLVSEREQLQPAAAAAHVSASNSLNASVMDARVSSCAESNGPD